MSTKTLRMFICTTLAVVAGTLAAAAHATFYDVNFDPNNFLGMMRINVSPSCFTPNNSINACAFDVDSLDFTDNFGDHWDILSPLLGIGDHVSILAGTPRAISVTIPGFDLNLVSGEGCGEGNTHLTFSIQSPTVTAVTFACPGSGTDSGFVTSITLVPGQVPEPATLALLGLGLVGLAASRRRKLH